MASWYTCRDVKPSNFLFLSDHADAPLKAIDFGMATYCAQGQKLEDVAGTFKIMIVIVFSALMLIFEVLVVL